MFGGLPGVFHAFPHLCMVFLIHCKIFLALSGNYPWFVPAISPGSFRHFSLGLSTVFPGVFPSVFSGVSKGLSRAFPDISSGLSGGLSMAFRGFSGTLQDVPGLSRTFRDFMGFCEIFQDLS